MTVKAGLWQVALPGGLRQGRTLSLPLLAALSAILVLALVEVLAWRIAGVFEYPLDDVYIHLAIASGLADGGYGINTGEAASAASSILYPFLLLPFPDTEFQRYLPLAWNVIGAAACGWLWGRVLTEGRLTGPVGIILAIAGPIALNFAGIAFLGMEHSLHTALTLATILSLQSYLLTGRIGGGFVAALMLAPLFRLEGVALSLLAVALIAWRGQVRAALTLALAVVAPVGGFCAALMAMGLPPLPSSVLVKAATPGADGAVSAAAARLARNLEIDAGVLLLVLSGFCVLLPLINARLRISAAGGVLLAVGLAGMAHVSFARVGWLHRYEHYIVVALIAGLVLAAPFAGRGMAVALRMVMVVSLMATSLFWADGAFRLNVYLPALAHLEQAQMARFAREVLRAPVAVNDLGRVAWENPYYVLDLWGLASERARRMRLQPAPPKGWAGTLTAERGVRLAMIYDDWIGDGIGLDWVRIGTLAVDPEYRLFAQTEVSFYATEPGAVADLAAKLRDFAPSVPAGAHLCVLSACRP